MARATYVFDTNPDGSYKMNPDGSMKPMVLKQDRKYPPSHDGKPMGNYIAPSIMSDIKPYQSTITGEEISSRSKHRAHLREHGCVEVGCDTPDDAKKYFHEDTSKQDKADRIEDIKQAYDKAAANG